jgi:hypothetical protein
MVEEVVGGGLTVGTGDDDLVLAAFIHQFQDIRVDSHGYLTRHGTGTAFKDPLKNERGYIAGENC